MGKCIDLTGQRFDRLLVIKRVENYINKKYQVAQWLCLCDCGNEVIVRSDSLRSGKVKSCGCLHKESASKQGSKNKKYNTYDLSGEYGIGYTYKGEEFYFDLEDYDKIKDYRWYIDKYGYVVARKLNQDKMVKLHKLLLPNVEVDHICHKKYDNRKSELRIVTRSQNNMNHGLRNDNTFGVVGICWAKRENKWLARITVDGKEIFLGYFDKFEDAVKARKEAEEKYFGEFSYDNSMILNNK